MSYKNLARTARQKLWSRYVNPLLFISIAMSIVILCSQLPSWGKAGLAEWQDRTPGGNTIGDTERTNDRGVCLYGKGGVYLDRIVDYGFYDGVVIGTTKSTGTEKYFLFHEQTKKIEIFNTKQDLCKKVQSRSVISRILDNPTIIFIICLCVWYSFCFLSGFAISLRHYWHYHGFGLKFHLNKVLDDPRFVKSLFGWALSIFVSPTIVNPFGALFVLAIFWVLWKLVFAVLLPIAKRSLILEDSLMSRSRSTTGEIGKFRSLCQCAIFVSVFIFGVSGILLAIATFTDNSFKC
jgi:hypothetical protein